LYSLTVGAIKEQVLLLLLDFLISLLLLVFAGGLQNDFCTQILCPFMITYSFGMKIWGLMILTQEGTIVVLFAFALKYSSYLENYLYTHWNIQRKCYDLDGSILANALRL
jgi:hypothetical protein